MVNLQIFALFVLDPEIGFLEKVRIYGFGPCLLGRYSFGCTLTPSSVITNSSELKDAASTTTIATSAINVSTATKQYVLRQLAPSKRLGDTTMDTFLSFKLLPRFHHLKIHTPPSWDSLQLPRDWRTDVVNSGDVVIVDSYRPARQHWILLQIETATAHIFVFDSRLSLHIGREVIRSVNFCSSLSNSDDL